MDRLVCGDVGYGKTEIAVRAAFKAVAGRQAGRGARADHAAGASSTTRRSAERVLPASRCNVKPLSRFQSRKEAEPTPWRPCRRRRRRRGRHAPAAVQRDFKFKDLGLVIVDEEQRFGVRAQGGDEEACAPTVDVLAMSATPIPRTLEMALDRHPRNVARSPPPPEERHPVPRPTSVRYEDNQVIRRRPPRAACATGRSSSCTTVVASIETTAREDPRARPRGPGRRRRTARCPSASWSRSCVDFWEKRFDVLRLHDHHRDRHRRAPTPTP